MGYTPSHFDLCSVCAETSCSKCLCLSALAMWHQWPPAAVVETTWLHLQPVAKARETCPKRGKILSLCLFFWTLNEGPRTGSRQRHHSTATGSMTTDRKQIVVCCLSNKLEKCHSNHHQDNHWETQVDCNLSNKRHSNCRKTSTKATESLLPVQKKNRPKPVRASVTTQDTEKASTSAPSLCHPHHHRRHRSHRSQRSKPIVATQQHHDRVTPIIFCLSFCVSSIFRYQRTLQLVDHRFRQDNPSTRSPAILSTRLRHLDPSETLGGRHSQTHHQEFSQSPWRPRM